MFFLNKLFLYYIYISLGCKYCNNLKLFDGMILHFPIMCSNFVGTYYKNTESVAFSRNANVGNSN